MLRIGNPLPGIEGPCGSSADRQHRAVLLAVDSARAAVMRGEQMGLIDLDYARSKFVVVKPSP